MRVLPHGLFSYLAPGSHASSATGPSQGYRSALLPRLFSFAEEREGAAVCHPWLLVFSPQLLRTGGIEPPAKDPNLQQYPSGLCGPSSSPSISSPSVARDIERRCARFNRRVLRSSTWLWIDETPSRDRTVALPHILSCPELSR
ncbi:uncharacterized protein BDR25DRAFT_84731 [Lindgomyces ingoldianus]|uniref:Uncharacterized protein n=1 Tax=Lindgomyces ingoldianus TaxID=673940 RepID=A0ACB6QEV5_9PLEO|nr:uncharacterized protein BDR25DRAFT_84731 [Lindgomyces ingoldianus]KAF2465529.1 hypothetical protein BDR25DRAFT_84731 [Lindgomyces ingoldianus]